jgi:acetyl-CoA C-acetyltransferase
MAEAVIYDAVRTPRGRGKAGGALRTVSPTELAAMPLRALRERNNLNTELVDDVVLGCVEPVKDQAADIARTAVLFADYAETVSGVQINRFCASGLEAVNMVAAKVMSGQAPLGIGGGIESMSRTAMGSSGMPPGTDPELAMPLHFIPQGVSADLIATRQDYTRRELDEFALTSQKRAANAWKNGYFKNSVIAVRDDNGLIILDHDENVRPDTTIEGLSELKPSFEKVGAMAGFDSVAMQRYPEVEIVKHFHHAGNSSAIVDGAAAVLIGTREIGKEAGLKARARIRAFANVGSEPTIMLTGPVAASRKALKLAGMSVKDIDLWEINEAFASVVRFIMDSLELDHDKVNVNGGAIALGHPLGATGAMLVGTMIDELERRNLSTGVVTLCIGSGMGVATVIERIGN